jgi:Zn-dependent protease
MNMTLGEIAAIAIALIFAIVFHEIAHGWMARALGDNTADEQNRLSLNPLRHVDPVGTVILPGFLAYLHAPVFGWAKPVPVNAQRLRNPRRDMMLVAAAGPGMNFLMATAASLLIGLLLRPYLGMQSPTGAVLAVFLTLSYFVQYNVYLGLFNLLPIPPFDGSHIVEGLLPDGPRRTYGRFRQFGMMLPILLFIVLPSLLPSWNITRYLTAPVGWVLGNFELLTKFAAGL